MQWRPHLQYICALLLALAWLPCHAVDDLSNAEEKWNETSKQVEASYKAHELAQNKYWKEMRKRVLQKWNDGAVPETKTYVEYFDKDSTRIKVDYEKGAVTVEAITEPTDGRAPSKVATAQITKALASVVEDTGSLNSVLSKDEIALDELPVNELAKSLGEKTQASGTEKGEDGQERSLYKVTFNLVPDYVKRRAAKYKPIVDIWATKYNLDPALILGIMRQESAFNSRARSWVGAIGLMQVYPKYAGLEVFQTVKKKNEMPSDDYLYNPEQNIMVGVTFLQILRDKYFSDIKDKEKQRYLIICGYNWSAGRLKKAIANGRLAIRAPASDVFERLQVITPAETQDYLRRVTQYSKLFSGKE